VFVLVQSYPNVALTALAALGCTLPDGDSTHVYLALYPYVQCSASDATFVGGLAAAIPALVLLLVGLPVLLSVLAYRLERRSAIGAATTSMLFLVAPYAPARRWWFVVGLLRKLAMAAFAAVVPFTNEPLLVIGVVLVLLLSVVANQVAQPYAEVRFNQLERMSFFVLVATFVSAYVAQAQTGVPPPWLAFVVLPLNVLALAWIVLQPVVSALCMRCGKVASEVS